MKTRRSFLRLAASHAALATATWGATGRFAAAAGDNAGIAGMPSPGAALEDRHFRIHMVLPEPAGSQENAFRQALRQRGLHTDIRIDVTQDDPSKLPAIVHRIRQDPPDLIYTTGTMTTLGLVGRHDQPPTADQIRDIPVVFTTVTDPVASGIIASLQKPGGNATGSIHIPPLDAQLRTILAYRRVAAIGTVYNPAEPTAALSIEKLAAAATDHQISLDARPLPLDGEGTAQAAAIPDLVADLARKGAQFLYIGAERFTTGPGGQVITQAALDQELPSFTATEPPLMLAPGALVGLVSAAMDQGLAAAYKAEQILVHGRSPAELPANPLSRYSLLINIATAHALHVYPPLDLIALAEFVGV